MFENWRRPSRIWSRNERRRGLESQCRFVLPLSNPVGLFAPGWRLSALTNSGSRGTRADLGVRPTIYTGLGLNQDDRDIGKPPLAIDGVRGSSRAFYCRLPQ